MENSAYNHTLSRCNHVGPESGRRGRLGIFKSSLVQSTVDSMMIGRRRTLGAVTTTVSLLTAQGREKVSLLHGRRQLAVQSCASCIFSFVQLA